MNMKRSFNFLMVLMMLFTSFVVSQPAGAAPEEKIQGFTPIRLDAPHVEGEIVVKMAEVQDKSLPTIIAQAFTTASESQTDVERLTADGKLVLKVSEDNLASKLEELNNNPNVLYAEPNYLFSIPQSVPTTDEYKLNSEYIFRKVTPGPNTEYKSIMAVPISVLQSMQTMRGSTIQATYPNDPYTFRNGGWDTIGADIVWPNNTSSAGVCVVDTGVQRSHKDFVYTTSTGTIAYRIINGYDFVWGDAVPNDENGHGTHVAGIIAAVKNNKLGIAGVSTGNVVAVKAVDAQGYGSNFDIAAAIEFCAKRSDIKVINLSVGSTTPAQVIHDAIDYAVNTKGKLVVAAAGNNTGVNQTVYPAAYAPEFANKLIAVAASGRLEIIDDRPAVNYSCTSSYTNYGSWVTIVAPGTDIYSTMPWDTSFYMNWADAKATRFDYLSGTSQAAPFVAAAAARYWGYKPTDLNYQVGAALKTYGDPLSTGGGCWDVSMANKTQVNVAKLLGRGALIAGVFDASNGTPLIGATISAYQGNVKAGSAVLAANTYKDAGDVDPNRVFMYSPRNTDIINLPVVGDPYTVRVNKSGYTVGEQLAFRHQANLALVAGTWTTFGDTGVPPKSANFNIVLVWIKENPYGDLDPDAELDPLKPVDPNKGIMDLDLNVWLPGANPTSMQPDRFIVGLESSVNDLKPSTEDLDDPDADNDYYGAMTYFPYARLTREGGFIDNIPVEMVSIRNRYAAYSTVVANAAMPYYPNNYFAYVTDYEQIIDHDNDGCGDNYGTKAPPTGYDPNYNPATDPDCPPNDPNGTLGIPLLGTYYTAYVYAWKDGVIKSFSSGADTANGGTYWQPGVGCNKHWWKAMRIRSGADLTVPEYTTSFNLNCDDGNAANFFPYLTPLNP